jgi:hypothetical protein
VLAAAGGFAACVDLGGVTGGSDGTPDASTPDVGTDVATPPPPPPPPSDPPPMPLTDAGNDTGLPANAKYKRTITIKNIAASPLPAAYAVCFADAGIMGVDLMSTGKVRTDYADLRVFGPSGERARVLDSLTTTRNELCFRLERTINPSATDNYELHYGDPTATLPPNALSQIFDFNDDFDGTMLATRWSVNGSYTVSGGMLNLTKNSQAGVTTTAGTDGIQTVSSLEMRLKIDDPASASDGVNGFWYWFGFQRSGDFIAADPWMIYVARDKSIIHAELKSLTGACTSGCGEGNHPQTNAFRVYRIDRTGAGNAAFMYDDGTIYNATGSDGDLAVMIRNWALTSDMHVDWVRARPMVTPEPTATLGAEQPIP